MISPKKLIIICIIAFVCLIIGAKFSGGINQMQAKAVDVVAPALADRAYDKGYMDAKREESEKPFWKKIF